MLDLPLPYRQSVISILKKHRNESKAIVTVGQTPVYQYEVRIAQFGKIVQTFPPNTACNHVCRCQVLLRVAFLFACVVLVVGLWRFPKLQPKVC